MSDLRMEECLAFRQRLNELGSTYRTYAMLIGVSFETVRAWVGKSRCTPPPEYALRQLKNFEENPDNLAYWKRLYPEVKKMRGVPFKRGNQMWKNRLQE